MQIKCGTEKLARICCILLLVVIGFCFVFGNTLFRLSHAYGADMGLSINVDNEESLSIILGGEGSDNNVEVDITPHNADGAFSESGDVTATVVSTVQNGYTLSMTRSSAAMSNTDSGVTATIDELASSENGYTSSTFPANKWGYSLKSGEVFGNYFGIGDGVELQNSSETTNGTTSTLKFGAKVNLEMPAGSYATTINFIAVARPESKYYMQDITMESCPANGMDVYDKRDEKQYHIKKVNTGEMFACWMTTNLDLAGGTIVDSELSNIEGNYTYTLPESSTSFKSSDNNLEVLYNSNNTICGEEDTPCASYYTFAVATANSNLVNGIAEYDICPKGWRLPTHEEWYTLDIDAQRIEHANSPINISYTGAFLYSYKNSGSHAYFRSSTPYSALIGEEDNYFNPNLGGVNYGFSIRCISKGSVIKTFIQDITIATCPSEPTTVYDLRDNQAYTIQRLADGNCWMLDNLRLDARNLIMPLSVANTNMSPEISFTLPNSTNSGFNSYTTAQLSNQNYSPAAENRNTDGVYYNYCAASAGTVCSENGSSTSFDICPKGWHLPTGGDSGQFKALYNSYSGSEATFSEIFNSALPGQFYEDEKTHNGELAAYWSSAVSGTGAKRLTYNSNTTTTNPDTNGDRRIGFSVRCVADSAPVLAIQDVTIATCPSRPTLTYDRRDNAWYYIQKLADGKCWMLDDLSLGGDEATLLTPSDTNIESNYTLPASVSDIGSYTEPQLYSGFKGTIVRYEGGRGKIGTYYNYCAATAGTYCEDPDELTNWTGPTNDICPAGWRMPTGGTNGEQRTLYHAYNSNDAATRSALRVALTGWFPSLYYEKPYGINLNAWFWSSNIYDRYCPYGISSTEQWDYDEFDALGWEDREYGESLRCILK